MNPPYPAHPTTFNPTATYDPCLPSLTPRVCMPSLPNPVVLRYQIEAYRDVFHKNRQNPKWGGRLPEPLPNPPEHAIGAFVSTPRAQIFTMEQRYGHPSERHPDAEALLAEEEASIYGRGRDLDAYMNPISPPWESLDEEAEAALEREEGEEWADVEQAKLFLFDRLVEYLRTSTPQALYRTMCRKGYGEVTQSEWIYTMRKTLQSKMARKTLARIFDTLDVGSDHLGRPTRDHSLEYKEFRSALELHKLRRRGADEESAAMKSVLRKSPSMPTDEVFKAFPLRCSSLPQPLPPPASPWR